MSVASASSRVILERLKKDKYLLQKNGEIPESISMAAKGSVESNYQSQIYAQPEVSINYNPFFLESKPSVVDKHIQNYFNGQNFNLASPFQEYINENVLNNATGVFDYRQAPKDIMNGKVNQKKPRFLDSYKFGKDEVLKNLNWLPFASNYALLNAQDSDNAKVFQNIFNNALPIINILASNPSKKNGRGRPNIEHPALADVDKEDTIFRWVESGLNDYLTQKIAFKVKSIRLDGGEPLFGWADTDYKTINTDDSNVREYEPNSKKVAEYLAKNPEVAKKQSVVMIDKGNGEWDKLKLVKDESDSTIYWKNAYKTKMHDIKVGSIGELQEEIADLKNRIEYYEKYRGFNKGMIADETKRLKDKLSVAEEKLNVAKKTLKADEDSGKYTLEEDIQSPYSEVQAKKDFFTRTVPKLLYDYSDIVPRVGVAKEVVYWGIGSTADYGAYYKQAKKDGFDDDEAWKVARQKVNADKGERVGDFVFGELANKAGLKVKVSSNETVNDFINKVGLDILQKAGKKSQEQFGNFVRESLQLDEQNNIFTQSSDEDKVSITEVLAVAGSKVYVEPKALKDAGASNKKMFLDLGLSQESIDKAIDKGSLVEIDRDKYLAANAKQGFHEGLKDDIAFASDGMTKKSTDEKYLAASKEARYRAWVDAMKLYETDDLELIAMAKGASNNSKSFLKKYHSKKVSGANEKAS